MKHTLRNWHTWVSLALGLPLLLVGLTTFFIAHEKSLGTKDIALPLSDTHEVRTEIRSVLPYAGGYLIGTKQGVLVVSAEGKAEPYAVPVKDEIRAIVRHGGAFLLAGKKGVWSLSEGGAERVLKGDCWQLVQDSNGYLATCKDEPLLRSQNGQNWQAVAIDLPEMAATETQMPLSKLMMDVHTGKFFLGKSAEWVWIDLLGACVVGLGLTGFVMWMRNRRTKAGS